MLCSIDGYSQEDYNLKFHIKGMAGEKFWLLFYYGDQQIRIDTAITDAEGRLIFRLNNRAETGMYRLENVNHLGVDFLFNRENIGLVTNGDFSLESIQTLGSVENEIFFDYYRHKYDLEKRLDILNGFLKYYPSTDTFYFTAADHAGVLSAQYQGYLDEILGNNPDLLVTRIIQWDQLPDIRPGELDETTRGLYRAHYFAGVDLADTLILNTPLLPVRIIDYLSLYVSPGISREKQEEFFTQAVDSLMKFSEGSPKVREMMVNYLITGFQAYGFENVLTHLVENYVIGQSCVSNQEEENLRIRIEGFRKMAVGTLAPDFDIPDSKGNALKLSGFRGEKVVLFFWSSECPHCKAVLPELNNLFAEFKKSAAFIAISVDKEEEPWREAIEEFDPGISNAAELEGWDGKVIRDYYIYATPTIFVLDPAGQIMAKPGGVGDLRTALEK